MNNDKEILIILNKMNEVLYALGEAVEEGFIEMKWINKATNEIQGLINALNILEKQNETDKE